MLALFIAAIGNGQLRKEDWCQRDRFGLVAKSSWFGAYWWLVFGLFGIRWTPAQRRDYSWLISLLFIIIICLLLSSKFRIWFYSNSDRIASFRITLRARRNRIEITESRTGHISSWRRVQGHVRRNHTAFSSFQLRQSAHRQERKRARALMRECSSSLC